MSYCGPIPGTCGHKETCLDEACEGHPANYLGGGYQPRPIDMDSAVLGARFSDGGHMVNGEDAEPIRLDPPVATPERTSAFVAWAVAIFCASAVAAAWIHAPVRMGWLAK